MLVEALQRRQVTHEQLVSELEAGAVRGSRVVREALRALASGAWSVPEADVLAELARSVVLPRVWANPRLSTADGRRLPTPDFWIDEVALAGQVHSRAFHSRDGDWEATVGADGLLTEHGGDRGRRHARPLRSGPRRLPAPRRGRLHRGG